MKVTKDMIEAFIGSDQEACKYLEEIVNGEYKAEQFREDVHFILDETPSQTSYWEQVYPLIETLDEDQRYMAEKIANDMWERHHKPHDYGWGY